MSIAHVIHAHSFPFICVPPGDYGRLAQYIPLRNQGVPSMPTGGSLDNVTIFFCSQFLLRVQFWFLIFCFHCSCLLLPLSPYYSLLSEESHLSLSVASTSLNLIQSPSFILALVQISLLHKISFAFCHRYCLIYKAVL